MKVGVVTDDGKTISPHFGMAKYFLVLEVEDGVIKSREMRPKAWHEHHPGAHDRANDGPEERLHGDMLSNARDCEALVARGMGRPMYASILELGIKPYVTRITDPEEAARAYADGTLAGRSVLSP